VTVELDVSAALAATAAAARPWQAVGLTAVVTAAAAGLLPGFPELNAAWGGEAMVLRRRIHVAVGEGGRWTVVGDASDLTARGVARALAGGRAGAATFALVSLAEGASWQCAAPPLPGTTAALSLGAPRRRAVVRGEAVAVRPVATLTLSYDARLVDHHRAAAFLRALCESLEGVLE
jgi:pyruvate/2-oxoglutarate dehydrogenase complex dihydrolipoamide acyltransferase (E2) component